MTSRGKKCHRRIACSEVKARDESVEGRMEKRVGQKIHFLILYTQFAGGVLFHTHSHSYVAKELQPGSSHCKSLLYQWLSTHTWVQDDEEDDGLRFCCIDEWIPVHVIPLPKIDTGDSHWLSWSGSGLNESMKACVCGSSLRFDGGIGRKDGRRWASRPAFMYRWVEQKHNVTVADSGNRNATSSSLWRCFCVQRMQE